MEKLRSWLLRQRDGTLVSYSRFGKPGDEEDDRPLPISITIAPFDDNAAEFIFLRYWHVQKAAVALSCFGMAMVIVFFLSSFFEFDWYHHERGVDLSALLGLFTYLALGVLIHYYVIYGVRKQLPNYLLPFIVLYSILCTCEIILCLLLTYKLLEAGERPFTYTSSSTTLQVFPSLGSIFLVTLVSSVIQTIMLAAVLKCRQYISLKINHDMEMKVAENSRTKNPSIQIIVANPTNNVTIPTTNDTPTTTTQLNNNINNNNVEENGAVTTANGHTNWQNTTNSIL